MQAALRSRGQIIEREVAVGDAVEAVRRRPIEAERLRRRVAVDRKASAGERRASERTLVHPRPRGCEPQGVPPQHLEIREQMMTERHRLRDLQMRESGHDRLGMLFRPCDQHPLQFADRVRRLVARTPHPQPKIGRDLVVARARGVQPSSRRADQLAEPVLDGHVNVLELELLRHSVALIVGLDRVETIEDRLGVFRGNNPLVA